MQQFIFVPCFGYKLSEEDLFHHISLIISPSTVSWLGKDYSLLAITNYSVIFLRAAFIFRRLVSSEDTTFFVVQSVLFPKELQEVFFLPQTARFGFKKG